MDLGLISNLMLGFDTALSLQNILYCTIGVTIGTLIGVLPGMDRLQRWPCCFRQRTLSRQLQP